MVPEAKGTHRGLPLRAYKQERLVEGISDFKVTADGKTLLIARRPAARVESWREAAERGRGSESRAASRAGSIWSASRSRSSRRLSGARCSPRPGGCSASSSGSPIWAAWTGSASTSAMPRCVDCLGSRGELSDLIWEMQGELGSSHAYEIGGEYRRIRTTAKGFLGVDWTLRCRSRPLHASRAWSGAIPGTREATSPLLEPGINVKVGDAVLAINGQAVTPERGPQQLLVNQAGQRGAMLIQPAADGEPRTVTVRRSATIAGALPRLGGGEPPQGPRGDRRAVSAISTCPTWGRTATPSSTATTWRSTTTTR